MYIITMDKKAQRINMNNSIGAAIALIVIILVMGGLLTALYNLSCEN